MGYDILGTNPTSEAGEYFRNTIWWWPPFANYVVERCNVNPGGWFSNGGHEVSAEEAGRIAAALEQLLLSGAVKEYEAEYKQTLANLPDEECAYCDGSGWRWRCGERVKGTCAVCSGIGRVPSFLKNYLFSEENVRAFADFCLHSGGFTIN